MLSNRLLMFVFALLINISLSSCLSYKSFRTQQDKIIGTWILQSMDVDGETIPAAFLGGKLMFEFGDDGIAHFTSPDGKKESGQYEVKQSRIIDPSSPYDEPLKIISLKSDKLVLSMIDAGEKIIITLIPEKEALGYIQ